MKAATLGTTLSNQVLEDAEYQERIVSMGGKKNRHNQRLMKADIVKRWQGYLPPRERMLRYGWRDLNPANDLTESELDHQNRERIEAAKGAQGRPRVAEDRLRQAKERKADQAARKAAHVQWRRQQKQRAAILRAEMEARDNDPPEKCSAPVGEYHPFEPLTGGSLLARKRKQLNQWKKAIARTGRNEE
ncbi:hypothetical protein SAICODRAFT_22686 [Saitoella complicata NRRL Y-17804]|uniref:Uncharacterized protein n=1 Tax=Saitoella complicata (strain BCRC 22490 / CBS 7301 / JCM 7358 / NBRC 10748 / NRRL Y-17804) TaxID=698492 RepID=A0A0E9NLV0_SAICN|nr:uncharacterized protein SAICODRAFT_22686 [Saitoella complicata NRRL Y-17804]ODQ56302.1 hypothetical protein SAICODRAFT_22686 [Saitoella complicata NRRL Y-17804]GAO50783.1 hypothetical protein G7K_4904-t1 [Saitoella complicata NRRL Y-17804]